MFVLIICQLSCSLSYFLPLLSLLINANFPSPISSLCSACCNKLSHVAACLDLCCYPRFLINAPVDCKSCFLAFIICCIITWPQLAAYVMLILIICPSNCTTIVLRGSYSFDIFFNNPPSLCILCYNFSIFFE